jgi:hypothetical protein
MLRELWAVRAWCLMARGVLKKASAENAIETRATRLRQRILSLLGEVGEALLTRRQGV